MKSLKNTGLQQYNQQLFSNVRRCINSLKQKQVQNRKNSIAELLKIVKNQQLPSHIFEQITYMALKQIIKCYYDYSEINRENSILLTIQLLSRCKNISFAMPYIMQALKDRTNCVDLDGIDKLPEKLRPNPGQKPKVMLKVVENCEQIRVLYCQLIKRIILLVDKDANEMVKHLDDMVNIQRALIMDPAPEIQKTACETLQIFCKDYSDILLHFTENMGRAILLPLISKKSKIRIAALNTLTAILWCGLWKYNAFVFQNLIGFRDPNSVAIKDFYQPNNNVNYLATFITDPNVRVRQQFMRHIKIWVCQINDKYDHHGKVAPYLLSGLSDCDQTIQKIAFETIVEIGRQIQEQKQKQFRESKQFAIDAKWTWQGKLDELPVDHPLTGRPSMGSRYFIRGHVRKMWPAIYKQVRDINEQHRIRAAKLAVYGAIFTENYLTQFLDNMIPQLLPSIIPASPEQKNVSDKIAKIFYYIGRYCQQTGYIHLIQAALDGKLIQNQQFVRCAMKGLSMLIKGNLEAIPEDQTLCHKKDDIIKILRVIEQCKIAGDVYNFNCIQARDIALQIFEGIEKKTNEAEKKQILQQHFLNLLKLLSVSQYEDLYANGFTLKKSELVQISTSQKFINFVNLMNRLIMIYPDSLDQLQLYLENIFCEPPSLMDSDWKIIVILHRYLCWQGQGNQRLGNLFLLVQDTICQCVLQNKSVQLLAFTVKYVYNLNIMNQRANHNLLPQSSKLLRQCLENLSRFKPMKKVPVYDQHLVKEDPDPHQLKISEQNYVQIFKDCSQAFVHYSLNKIQIPKKELAGLIYYYIQQTLARIRKNQQCINQSVKTMWAVFQKIADIGQKLPNQLIWITSKKQKVPAIPIMIEFCVERLEEYLPSNMNMMVFNIFQRIVKCWPVMINMTQKIPNVCPAFLDLLQKLFKYTLNEKDMQNKQKYISILSALAKKMPSWFKTQARLAQQGKRYEKHRMIEQIIKDANI